MVGIEPDGEFRRLAGRTISLIFLISGILVIVYASSSFARGAVFVGTMLALGLVTTVAGMVMFRLPWHRWPRHASLWVVVPALALIGFGNSVDPDPYMAGTFFFLVAMWLGIAQPRGMTLAVSPLFAVAYWAPLALVPHAPGLTESVPYMTATCVLAGESLAWFTARLHTAQRRLREHDERRFQALLATSSDTTIVVGVAGALTYVSPSAVRVLRVPAEELRTGTMATYVEHHVHPEDAGHLGASLDHLFTNVGAEETVQFRVGGPDQAWCHVEGVGRSLLDDEAVRGVLFNLRDVSERTRLEVALTHQAFTDQLTGLPNRTLLRDRAEQALRLAGRRGHTAALVLIDLDRFKEVNDTLGHHHGDAVLRQVAERLRTVLRESDTVARLGGDEFAVLLPQVATIEDAIEVADKLRAVIETPFTIEGLTLEVGASMGLAAYPDHAANPG